MANRDLIVPLAYAITTDGIWPANVGRHWPSCKLNLSSRVGPFIVKAIQSNYTLHPRLEYVTRAERAAGPEPFPKVGWQTDPDPSL
jgi:hypothetical protein